MNHNKQNQWTSKHSRRALVLVGLLYLGMLVPGGWARSHPFMVYTPTELSTIKSKLSDPFYSDIYNEILIDCRSRFGPGDSIDTKNPVRDYWTAIRSHGALILLDPVKAADSRYQSKTRFFSYYNAVLNLPGWSNFFNNDTVTSPYLLAGLVLGYDMNWASFSSTQRADIRSKLAARADYIVSQSKKSDGGFLYIEPDLYNASSSYIHTFKVLRNKFVMTFSALGLIAYALEGEVDETRRQGWLKTVDASLAAWNSKAMPDGLSLESYSYHELMVEILFLFMETKTRVTGKNQFLIYPYVALHPLTSIYSWVPGGDRSFISGMPWGDGEPAPAGDMRTNVSVFTRRLKGTSSNYMSRVANWMQYRPPSGVSNNSYSRTDSLHLFYADPSMSMVSPAEQKLPLFRYFYRGGVFVWRSGWDNMATYFSMTASPQLGGHQQTEQGAFTIFKGGAPFIAPHYYLDQHRAEDHNVMLIDGKGQLGENLDTGSSKPQPSSTNPKFLNVLGDDAFFNVLVDLKGIQATTRLSSYTREYMGFSDYYFVRDKTACTASVSQQNVLHAYKTVHPTDSLSDTVDIDSDPRSNPWSGSGSSWTLKPRSNGPFTGGMTVKDLSTKAWSSALKADMIDNHETGSVTQRGYKLTFSQTASSASALMVYAFPASGETIGKWPGSDGDGFKITYNGALRALGVWPANGSIKGTDGLTMNGTMGGLHPYKGWIWGRNVSLIIYKGVQYLSSTGSISIFATTLTSHDGRIRVVTSGAVTIYLRCNQPVSEVTLNGTALPTSQWSLSNKTLKLYLPTSLPNGGTILLKSPTASTISNSAWLDLN